MWINSDGEVRIGTNSDNGAYNLQVNGTGVWGAGAYVNGSDERLKEDIQPIDSALDVVSNMNPVTYKYKEDYNSDRSVQTGFIAQELNEALDGQVYKEGIVKTDSEYMSVAYQSIIPLLTKAIQEQQVMINELKKEIDKLKQ
jgi:archaellum component FlaC